MFEMMIWTMFPIVKVVRISGVQISKKAKCAKQTAISNIWKYCKSHIHSVRNVGNDDLNYVFHS